MKSLNVMFLEDKNKFNFFTSFVYFIFETLSFRFRKKILSSFEDVQNKKILEIGCGTGSNSLILAQKRADVTGIDLSKSQIYFAQKRAKKYKDLKLTFKQIDATKLYFPSGYFDLIICFYSLHELGKIEILHKVVSEMKQVLKTQGRIVILDYNISRNILVNLVFQLIFLFEPKETLNYILKTNISTFAKEHNLKIVKKDCYWFNSLKLWIFKK